MNKKLKLIISFSSILVILLIIINFYSQPVSSIDAAVVCPTGFTNTGTRCEKTPTITSPDITYFRDICGARLGVVSGATFTCSTPSPGNKSCVLGNSPWRYKVNFNQACDISQITDLSSGSLLTIANGGIFGVFNPASSFGELNTVWPTGWGFIDSTTSIANATPVTPYTSLSSCQAGETLVDGSCSFCDVGTLDNINNVCYTSYIILADCTLDGVTIESGSSGTFYSIQTSNDCNSYDQIRNCTDGVLDGLSTYQYASCNAPASAEGVLNSYAWSDNIGWVSFEDSQVVLEKLGDISGYAWSDNIGWVNFNPTSGFPSAPNHGSKVLGNGDVTGWARAISYGGGWDGWISMNGSKYGVSFDFDTNKFSGYAWGSDVVGWLSFGQVALSPGIPKAQANPDTIGVNEGIGINVNVLANDTPIGGISIQSVGSATYGTVSDNGDGTVRYTNISYGAGSDSFSYTIVDGSGNTSSAAVSISIYQCGDGTIQLGEQCDNGVNNGPIPASCSTSCLFNVPPPPPPAVCGNSICEQGESFFSCPADCTATFQEF